MSDDDLAARAERLRGHDLTNPLPDLGRVSLRRLRALPLRDALRRVRGDLDATPVAAETTCSSAHGVNGSPSAGAHRRDENADDDRS
jgi:hypothetical protein